VKSHGSCPKCGSLRIVREALVPDRTDASSSNPLSIRVVENPAATLFRVPRDFPLRAWVCGDCGYTEFYATQPEELVASERRARQAQASNLPDSQGIHADMPRALVLVAVTLAVLIAIGLAALLLLIVRTSP